MDAAIALVVMHQYKIAVGRETALGTIGGYPPNACVGKQER